MRNSRSWPIAVLALLGIALSVVSLVNHYKTSETDYCDFGENFNCDLVNRSIYSEIAGVPVALIGLIGYLALMVLALLPRAGRAVSALLLAGGLVGLAFSLYLTYIEARVLFTWCIVCLGSLAIIFLITVLSAVRLAKGRALTAATERG